ncbi:MAG: V-type ATPase subunit [Candidatus Micrarchaeota archaeon]|nr:V-type ATPase subunit [Candidatus Micrarchaeota archaeon]
MKAGMVERAARMLTFKPLVYGYANARVRAMRTALLSRRQIEELIRIRTNAGVAEYLTRTSYKDDFGGLPANLGDEERVEIAISRNFARTARKVLRITPKQGKPTIVALLGRYDAHNIKTILLARKLGKSKQETEMLLLPAGSISSGELESMLDAKNADELYDMIKKTQFGGKFLASEFSKHLPKAQIQAALKNPQEGRLEILLAAIDSYYYHVVSSAVMPEDKDSKTVLDLLQKEIDAKNILTIMRLKQGGAERKEIAKSLVSGGSIQQKHIEKMLGAKDAFEVAKLATELFFSKAGKLQIAEVQKKYEQDGMLSHFEVAFENWLAKKSLVALRRSMMSLGTIAGFLFLKEEEVNNIRKIVRGKALGLSPQQIEQMMVLVE